MSGGDSQVVTPVPMPNTEVKHLNAESSWGLPPVRIGRCQALDRSADCRSVFLCYVKLQTVLIIGRVIDMTPSACYHNINILL